MLDGRDECYFIYTQMMEDKEVIIRNDYYD